MIKLSPRLLQAWQDAVLALARLPRGFDRQGASAGQKLSAILRSEMGGIHELWEIFTQDRGELGKFLVASKPQAVAYLLGFHLPNCARMQLALTRLEERYAFAEMLKAATGTIMLHDLGCGSGAMSHALVEFALAAGTTESRLHLHASDVSGLLLDTARQILAAAAPQAKLATHKTAIEQLPAERFGHRSPEETSIYTLGYVYNELTKNPRAQRNLQKIFDLHREKNEAAMIFLLEPGTQGMSRAAMEWRDRVTKSGWAALYPCPASTPCPMLERTRDWCYSEGAFDRPPPVLHVDEKLGTNRSRFASSIFVLATPAMLARLTPRRLPAKVVVGRPERSVPNPKAPKVGDQPIDYLLCAGTELQKVPAPPGREYLPRGVEGPA